ncbi:MAG: hypothetical protein LBG58_11350 [Planctomycetaceae bacterium]|nr:hypothetical protein [Planctomycetaceae bacterium]
MANLEEAKLWAWQHQDNRRNLIPFIRAEIALKFKEAIATKSKERQLAALKQNTVPQNSAERITSKETRQELAEIADVSHDTINRVEYILEHADEETKEKLRRNEKGTSINKEYNRLKKQSAPKAEKSDTTADVT